MSFVTTIRDYVECLNTISDSFGSNFTYNNFLTESFLYFSKTLQYWLLYIVSFQWIRDFTLLPIILPEISAQILNENIFLENPEHLFFNFLEIPDLNQNKFLLGFFNSFFLSLPISLIHIVSIRNLLIKGIPAAVFSIGGYAFGQILFLSCIVFGIREIVFPVLTLEPFNYFLGLILMFRIIYPLTSQNLNPVDAWIFLPAYKNYFLTSFLLAWCEQTSVYQYLGNLTLSSNVTLLESFSSNSSTSSFFTHFFYIFGIFYGFVVFTCLWGIFFLQLKNFLFFVFPFSKSKVVRLINKTTFILAVALSLTSIPFYSVDYLVTGPLGFVSQDSLFKETFWEEPLIKEAKTPMIAGDDTQNLYIDVDGAPFDRGDYFTIDVSTVPDPLSFEDLNYAGEYEWTTRYEKLSRIVKTGNNFLITWLKLKPEELQITNLSWPKIRNQNKLILMDGHDIFYYDPSEFERIGRYLNFTYGEDLYIPLPNDPDPRVYLIDSYILMSKTSFRHRFLVNKRTNENDLEKRVKGKYYSNPLYKVLLTLDIDIFLTGQPQKFHLSPNQELELIEKRRLLNEYCNTLRDYLNPIRGKIKPFHNTFDAFYNGTKSFSNKVYNQQFKGTLKVVRRLFSLTPDPLSETSLSPNPQNLERVLKFDQPLYEFSNKQNISLDHEEVLTDQEPGTSDDDCFLETDFLMNPLYAGWDENLRKFVITNKFPSRAFPGSLVNIDEKTRGKFSTKSTNQQEQLENIQFTAWPLSKEAIGLNDLFQIPDYTIPLTTLFKTMKQYPESDDVFSDGFYDTLPSNVEFWNRDLNRERVFESPLVPNRGGFIWPGNSNPKSEFLKKFIKVPPYLLYNYEPEPSLPQTK